MSFLLFFYHNGYILYFRGGPKPLRDESRINFRYDGRHVFTRPQKASLKAKLAANKRF